MLPKHFYAVADGYLRKEYKENAQVRKLGYLTILPHIDTKKHSFSFDKFCEQYWPLAYEDNIQEDGQFTEAVSKQDFEEAKAEQKRKYLEIMHAHNPKRYQQIISKNGVKK